MKVEFITDKGNMVAELYEKETPNTVNNFVKLIKKGFYNDLTYHRVIPQFMVQGGCPKGNGTGGPGYAIDCETNGEGQYHDRGVLSMAHAGKNTGGSQYLDRNHTCFGKVVKGLDVIDQITQGDKFSINLV
jgi:peptidyl-prolyl cis-trans isomerase B (cyclophilin B)